MGGGGIGVGGSNFIPERVGVNLREVIPVPHHNSCKK